PPREVAARVTTVAANATRARYLALASDPSATEIARAAAAEAAALAYAPLTARTQLALGAALETDRSTQKTKAPVEAYRAASDAALSAGDDVMFVEAFARELFAASRRGHERVPELVAALSFVRAIGKRTGDRGGFARALLYNNAGTQRMAAGDPAGALAWLREARTALDEHPYGVELWAILGNLAMVVTDHGERDALFAAESVQFERVLGPDHPLTLSARLRAAAFVDDPHESSVRLAETCRTWLARHPQRRDKVASCHYELGWLAVQRDDTAAAIAAFRTVTSQADSTANNQLALAELARLGGDPHRAIGLATIVAASIKRRDGWWDLVPRIDAWLTIAAAYHALANDRAALAALDRARSMTLHPLLSHPVTPVQRRRARVTTLLAIATLVW
ncbi:MAG TPA: hypothetical protein VK427_25010, partial [Kofleriaceae bacterium]|nr:hypothetical protein [Kofleriaceae bacterium]